MLLFSMLPHPVRSILTSVSKEEETEGHRKGWLKTNALHSPIHLLFPSLPPNSWEVFNDRSIIKILKIILFLLK